jgi:hypothetical protein
MGGHVDSGQAALFQETNFVAQGCNQGKFERSRFFTPSPLKFRDSAHKGTEARLMILIVEPGPVPSLHRNIKEADVRVGLKTHTPDDLKVSGTRLIFQEKIILEQGKIRGIPRKALQRWTKTMI